VKLVRKAFLTQPGGDFVDAFGDYKAWAIDLLGQKISHGTADGTSHADDVAATMHKGKLAVNLADPLRISAPKSLDRLFNTHVKNQVFTWIEQIHKSLDVCMTGHV
jgi:hypothetical protein